MSKHKSTVSDIILDRLQNHHTWDAVIREAEAEIESARQRVSCLKRSVEIFRQRKAAGDPYPKEGRHR